MVGLYRITNQVNGKFYIGQSKDIERRIKQHNLQANDPNNLAYNSPLHQDIRRYGWENFISEVLLECELDELSYKEQELISAAQILSKDLLYNVRNDFVSSRIAQYTLEGELIKIWDSTKELRISGWEVSNILRVCRDKLRTSAGYIWRFVMDEDDAKEQGRSLLNESPRKSNRRREIIQYDLSTHQVIERYPSARAASIALDKTCASPILDTCKGKYRQAYGYGWAYADEFENWE